MLASSYGQQVDSCAGNLHPLSQQVAILEFLGDEDRHATIIGDLKLTELAVDAGMLFLFLASRFLSGGGFLSLYQLTLSMSFFVHKLAAENTSQPLLVQALEVFLAIFMQHILDCHDHREIVDIEFYGFQLFARCGVFKFLKLRLQHLLGPREPSRLLIRLILNMLFSTFVERNNFPLVAMAITMYRQTRKSGPGFLVGRAGSATRVVRDVWLEMYCRPTRPSRTSERASSAINVRAAITKIVCISEQSSILFDISRALSSKYII